MKDSWDKVSQSPVTSHSYDTREGIVSHAWYEILRLSPHLFWLGFFSHRAFSSAQDDDTRGRMGSHIWFKVQGSGLRWRLRRLFYWAMLESGILVMGYQL